MKYCVYLAGPITGLTYDGATNWRHHVSNLLNSQTVECMSPMRGKEFLQGKGPLHSGTYDGILTTGKGIMRRDHFDCTRASCLLVNLLGTKKVSIGTVMEVAWAYDRRIPTVVVMEPDNVHSHVMFNEGCHYVVQTLAEAVLTVQVLLNDDTNEEVPEWLK